MKRNRARLMRTALMAAAALEWDMPTARRLRYATGLWALARVGTPETAQLRASINALAGRHWWWPMTAPVPRVAPQHEVLL